MKWKYIPFDYKTWDHKYFVPETHCVRYANYNLFKEKKEWCINHNSKVRTWLLFKRDACCYYSSFYGVSGWLFEKEADMNWFLLRWA